MNDNLTALAEAHAHKLDLIADTLRLLANDAPSILQRAETQLRHHSRACTRLIDAIHDGVTDLANWDTFLDHHPELH